MPPGLIVCPKCHGRGRVYRGHGRAEVCPDCYGQAARQSLEARQFGALDAVRQCFKRLEAGETGAFNFELAVRGALQAGLELEQIARRTGVPLRRLRKGAAGQGELL
jgi:hypothetical protein